MNEIVTPELKAKIAKHLEKSSEIIEEQSEFIEELQRRLSLAEAVCRATDTYIRFGNSPIAVGWDQLIDTVQKWKEEKAKEVDDGQA